jgi:hypothetical protein
VNTNHPSTDRALLRRRRAARLRVVPALLEPVLLTIGLPVLIVAVTASHLGSLSARGAARSTTSIFVGKRSERRLDSFEPFVEGVEAGFDVFALAFASQAILARHDILQISFWPRQPSSLGGALKFTISRPDYGIPGRSDAAALVLAALACRYWAVGLQRCRLVHGSALQTVARLADTVQRL